MPLTPAQSYRNLPDGPKSFEVRATDPAGNTDLSPASRAFTVDTSAARACEQARKQVKKAQKRVKKANKKLRRAKNTLKAAQQRENAACS